MEIYFFFTLFLFKHSKNHPQLWKLNHSSQIIITWKKCAGQEPHISYSFVNSSYVFLQCQPGKEGQSHALTDKQDWQSGGNRWENWATQQSFASVLSGNLSYHSSWRRGGPSHKGEKTTDSWPPVPGTWIWDMHHMCRVF